MYCALGHNGSREILGGGSWTSKYCSQGPGCILNHPHFILASRKKMQLKKGRMIHSARSCLFMKWQPSAHGGKVSVWGKEFTGIFCLGKPSFKKYRNFMKYFHKMVTPPPRTAFMKSLFRFPHWFWVIYYFWIRDMKSDWPPRPVCEIIS